MSKGESEVAVGLFICAVCVCVSLDATRSSRERKQIYAEKNMVNKIRRIKNKNTKFKREREE